MTGRAAHLAYRLHLFDAVVATRPTVFDYSFWRPDPHALKAAGIVGVQRYLTTTSSAKRITKPEYDALHAAGLAVLLGFEDASTSWQGGRQAGLIHGRAARAQARALGHPDSRPIAFAIDSGDQVNNVGTAVAYVSGCVDGSGTGRQMVYAGTNVIEACWHADLITGGWQPAAASWSQVPSNHVVLKQLTSKSFPQFPPSAYDENLVLAADWGQWPIGGFVPEPPFTVADANLIWGV
jgi:hypothetical protein